MGYGSLSHIHQWTSIDWIENVVKMQDCTEGPLTISKTWWQVQALADELESAQDASQAREEQLLADIELSQAQVLLAPSLAPPRPPS